LSDFRIISRHVLGVIRAPIIIQTAIIASIAIAIQSGIEFLGLGDKNTPSWGAMLNDAFRQIYQAPVLLIWPSMAVSLISIALVVFANTLRDELERTGPKKVKSSNSTTSVLVAQEVVASQTIVHQDANREQKDNLLAISNLAVGYPDGFGGIKRVVQNATISINKGEVVGLIGESGSGKTQTAFALLGLLPAGGKVIAGSIIFDGDDLTRVSSKEMDKIRGARISYIPQEPMSNLDPSFTIGSQLVEPMVCVMKISKQEATSRAFLSTKQ
jgi:peptide/nickel transport system permease protein